MSNKVVVITGAFGALGQTVVEAAVSQGHAVAAVDMAPAVPAKVTEILGKTGAAFPSVDLTQSGSAATVINAIKAQFGQVDALINIAGGFRWETIGAGSLATFDKLYQINVSTAVNAIQAALPELVASKGVIINIGANGAVKAAMGMGAYAASKAGVHKLTEALAEEVKGTVRVNAVLPSIIDTPTNRADMPDADTSKWVTPAQLASVILFLISDEAVAVTGALIPVTGGL